MRGVEGVDAAGGEVRAGLVARRLLLEPGDVALVVDHAHAVALGLGDRLDGERGQRVRGAVALGQRAQVDRVQAVGGADEEALAARAQEVAAAAHAAGRAEQLRLVRPGDVEAELRAVAERVADGVRVVVEVHGHLAHVVAREAAEEVLEHRAVGDRDERLRQVVGERGEPRAEARRHHEGPHRERACAGSRR